jgi:hypothetical protein
VPLGRSGRMRKISPSPGFDPRTFLPVASRYTEWSNSAQYTVWGGYLENSEKIKECYGTFSWGNTVCWVMEFEICQDGIHREDANEP